MLDGASLYYLGTTLQVERCGWDVAGGHTLPMSPVINDPYLLVIQAALADSEPPNAA
jgi:hypothetical protein